ncbi:MAG: hypothetical protein M3Z18_06635 [Gemmatimonadota bacterium]|nr:hypothetical protein [Gemmatimonadota bacterium]
MSLHLRVAVALLPVSVAVQSAAAQQRASVTRSTIVIPAAVSGHRPAVVDSAGDSEVRLRAILATGAPRSYQVVSISVPEQLAGASNVEIELVPLGEFAILGPRRRVVDASGTRKVKVGITIGIPAGALAGRLTAAEARFSSPGSTTLVVPIDIDVSLVRAIKLRFGTAPINAQAGSDVMVPFEIVNSGNSQEIVAADLGLPSGWSIRGLRQTAIVVDPGQSVKRRVRLAIPALASTGSSFVQVDLRSSGEKLASETITIEVFNSGSIGRYAGPLIVSAISQASDENGHASRLLTLSATGALFDSVHVDARLSQGSARDAAASNAFAHLGSFQSSASVVLTAPSGQLSLGNTGTSFSELTGLYPYGEGALLNLLNPVWSLQALGAVSMTTQESNKREPMIGIRVAHSVGQMQLSSSVTHLADAGTSPRRLDAIGIAATAPSVFGSTFKAEIAERQFQGGRGFGWSSEMVRTSYDHDEQLRVTHAPGGSDAFARATNEIVANVSERLSSRSSVSASAWRTTDATSVFSGLTSNGFSLRPQYELHAGTTIALEARSYLFDATSRQSSTTPGGGFGSKESQLGISVNTNHGPYYLNSSAFLGSVTRTVSPVGQFVIKDRTPRNYWTTNAGWSGAGGIVEVQTRVEQTRDAGGFVNQQSMVGIHGSQVVIPWFGGIRAEGDLQRVYGFGNERSGTVRAGIAVPLINGAAFRLDAERNSIFRSVTGRVPWIVGIRFEHSLTVPMLRVPGTSGYVFEDVNGNQRRDAGERGVAGALVRRSGEVAVTDANGKYRIGGDSRQAIAVDEASLPDGWTASGSAGGDLSVTLSTSAIVELVVVPRSGISGVRVDLSKAHILACDSSGREWVARMTGPTTATFESLPVGTYALDFDLSELSEPLVARAPTPLLVVSGKESRSVTVTLDPRPIRMWNGSGQRGNGAQPSHDIPPADKGSKSPADETRS